jgi:transcriptional regulator with XRE-family HTH domain
VFGPNDLTDLAERLARARRTYGERIDLPNLGRVAFATLLGVSASTYEAYERGDRMPTADFLAVLHRKIGTSLE